MAGAKNRSAFDCFPAQIPQLASKALRPQQQWEYRQRALFVRFRMRRGRSPEEGVDSMAATYRETRDRLLCPPHCGDRYLRERFSIYRPNQKFLRHESRRCARNRSVPFAIFPEAIATSRYRSKILPDLVDARLAAQSATA